MKKTILNTAIILGFGLSVSYGQSKPKTQRENEHPLDLSNKQKVVALLKSIETGDANPVAYINANKYIQHNLGVADGLAGFGNLLAQLPPKSAKVNTVRVFQDGDFVFAHTNYNFFGPKVGFDIFRFENGKIVEHWDNLQETPTKPNPSGHTLIDGVTEVKDLDKTEANKAFIGKWMNDVFIEGKMETMPSYFNGDNYIQHNSFIADGLTGLGRGIKAMADKGITMKFDKIHRVLGEGNFVLTVSEGTFAGKHTAFYDLFRVENGKIAEHWDTLEEIPAKVSWKNNNGKF